MDSSEHKNKARGGDKSDQNNEIEFKIYFGGTFDTQNMRSPQHCVLH